ncbi:MAG: heterodisulfide reductase-related iron-sulfur binding cluster [Thermostichales cyanobacterium DRC_bins_46]
MASPEAYFDAQHPPDPALISACVHCGFCLTTCPSYRVLGTEMDSPRGRIYQMDAIHRQEISLTAAAQHFDTCLGCLACTTACPSGVQYDRLIAATRPQIERQVPRSWEQTLLRQLLFQLLPYPQRLRPLLRPLQLAQKLGIPSLVRPLLSRLSPQLAALEALLPPLTPEAFRDPQVRQVAAEGERRFRVGMILGCVQRLFNPAVNAATIRVLVANGCEVVIPPDQGCCGALSHHQGQEQQAQTLARQMIRSFAQAEVDYIIINASGCGHTLKEYARLLPGDPEAEAFVRKVRDVQEFLVEVGWVAPLHPLADCPLRLVYQDACHMIHGQKISWQPRQLLRQIPGVSLSEPVDAALCCGSAGVYNILQPQVAQELGRQKVENLLATDPDVIVSANIGCFVQISHHLAKLGVGIPVLHPMQLLDAAIRGQGLEGIGATVRHRRPAQVGAR